MKSRLILIAIAIFGTAYVAKSQTSDAEADAVINLFGVQKKEAIGKLVAVSPKDSAAFWKKQLDFDNDDAFVYAKVPYKPCDSCQGYKIYWRDTNTVRQIVNLKK